MLNVATFINNLIPLPRIDLGDIWSWFTVTSAAAPTRPVDPEKGGEPLAWVYWSEQERNRMPAGFVNPSQDGQAIIFIPLAQDGIYEFQKAERLNLAPQKLVVSQEERIANGITYVSVYTLFETVLNAKRAPADETDTKWAAACYFGRAELKKVLPSKGLAHYSLT